MPWNYWIVAASVLGGIGVAMGAFGAHVLKTRVEPDQLAIFETAVHYQIYHSLALLAVGLLARHGEHSASSVAGYAFLIGILVFSGSLYLLVLSGYRWLGAITPIGGVAFLIGWLALAHAAWRAA